MRRTDVFHSAYEALFDHYGPQGWWPGETAFEVMVGAILTQNTNWGNAERAIARLRLAGVLSPRRIDSLAEADLAELIRPSGYFNMKARRLKAFVHQVMSRYGGSPGRMRRRPFETLRRELLGINGVGPETADSMLLYALGFPIFVVDAYTRRIFSRHGAITTDAGYHEIQERITGALPRDADLFAEYHALIVRLGKERCRKARPACRGCPLEHL